MGDTPAFLKRLGLDADADKPTIRRAYARELKQIDQEADAASFQALREAYDAALAWLERLPVPSVDSSPVPNFRPRQTALTFRTVSPSPSPTVPRQNPVQPAQLAAEVFEDFEAVCSRLAAGLHAQDVFYWRTALERHHDDQRLLNLDARTAFESLVAKRLAAGWIPGNETLLVAAADLFGWMADQRTLQPHGHSGRLINQALEEGLIFEAQPMSELTVQRAIIHRLRDPEPPDELQISMDMPNLERMLLRFPTWLPMVLDKHIVNLWRRIHLASFGTGNSNGNAKTASESRQSVIALRTVGFILALIFSVFVGTLLIGAAAKSYFAAAPSPTPAPARLSENYSLGPTPILPPTSAQLDEIQSRISYQASHLGGVRLNVQFQVVLNDKGDVEAANNMHSSGLPEFDDLVERAIKGAPKFPGETQRIFIVNFTNKK